MKLILVLSISFASLRGDSHKKVGSGKYGKSKYGTEAEPEFKAEHAYGKESAEPEPIYGAESNNGKGSRESTYGGESQGEKGLSFVSQWDPLLPDDICRQDRYEAWMALQQKGEAAFA